MRGRSAPYLSAKSAGDKLRQIPSVIEMRMRQHNVRNVGYLDRKRIPIHLAKFATALEETTIDQHTAMRRGAKKIFGAGHLTRSAKELKRKHSSNEE